jgi:hypothetical protein
VAAATLLPRIGPLAAAPAVPEVRRLAWQDLTPLSGDLSAHGITGATHPTELDRLSALHRQRIREGDLDHLVFYVLQSRAFTSRPAIEPALSASAFVQSLPPDARADYLAGGDVAPARIPDDVSARVSDFLRALDKPGADVRRRYFAELVDTAFPDASSRAGALEREYFRAMRFVYQKEFAARQAAAPGDAVAALYRTRGLSTDTEVEAGFLVSTGIGIAQALDPAWRVRRILVIGPGLDLAPRTGLLEFSEPESYQPWAVLDAVVARGLGTLGELVLVAADINPRVVSHLAAAASHPPRLDLVTGLRDEGATRFTPAFRDYFQALGSGIAAGPVSAVQRASGHLRKTLPVSAGAAQVLRPVALDAVVERLDPGEFDLVVATNVLPYFDDEELTLAIGGVAAMLRPGGIFLHNEARPSLQRLAERAGLPLQQARTAAIVDVAGAPAPLVDGVWVHRKTSDPAAGR